MWQKRVNGEHATVWYHEIKAIFTTLFYENKQILINTVKKGLPQIDYNCD